MSGVTTGTGSRGAADATSFFGGAPLSGFARFACCLLADRTAERVALPDEVEDLGAGDGLLPCCI
jgi:hypothetical protein